MCTAPAAPGKKKYLLRSLAAIALQSTRNARWLSEHLRFPELARRLMSESRYGDVRVLTFLGLQHAVFCITQQSGALTKHFDDRTWRL